MNKVEIATSLDYITMRNYAVDRDSGQEQVVSSSRPIIPHTDYLKFLEAALRRIRPDGTIDWGTRFKADGPIEIKKLSSLSPREQYDLRDHLAEVLLIRGGAAANTVDDPDGDAAYLEGCVAQEAAPYRFEFEFLQAAAEIAANPTQRWQLEARNYERWKRLKSSNIRTSSGAPPSQDR